MRFSQAVERPAVSSTYSYLQVPGVHYCRHWPMHHMSHASRTRCSLLSTRVHFLWSYVRYVLVRIYNILLPQSAGVLFLFFLLGTDADRRECNYIRGPKLFRTCKVLLKLSRPASATTARQGGYSQRSSAAFAQRARQSRGCSSCADCKNSDERGKFPLHVLHRPPESV